MEDIAPPLRFLSSLRMSIDKGDSVSIGLQRYLQTVDDELSRLVATWFLQKSRGESGDKIVMGLKSPYRRACLMLVGRGLAGEPIQSALAKLEEETLQASQNEIEEFLALLPMKMLVPLLFFQFPAFLFLLLGPLLIQFLQKV